MYLILITSVGHRYTRVHAGTWYLVLLRTIRGTAVCTKESTAQRLTAEQGTAPHCTAALLSYIAELSLATGAFFVM